MTVTVFGPSAIEASWADARDKVRRDVWRPSSGALPDDQVDRAIHSALLELEAERRWLWLEGINGTLTTLAITSVLNIPASVKSVTSLAYVNGVTVYDILDQEPVAQVRQSSRGTAAGYPVAYAISNGVIYLDSTVKSGAEFEMFFTSGCSRDRAAAILTPPFTLTREMPAVVANACSMVALSYLKDEEESARMRALYERILDRLMVEEDTARADAQMGGSIVPDSYYHQAAFGS